LCGQPIATCRPTASRFFPTPTLADLYAYLQSIPKDPDPKTIPLLNQQ